MMKTESYDLARAPFLHPPGGLAVWIFITVELLTFGGAILVFLLHRGANAEAFNAAQAELNRTIGIINTLLLVTSGFIVAQAVDAFKRRHLKRSANLLLLGGGLGSAFLGLKIFEYSEKWTAGHGIGDGEFFGYYWGLTGFHFLHVVIGVYFLFALTWKLHRGDSALEEDAGVEAGAAYWHLCDLIWILIFPLLYILN